MLFLLCQGRTPSRPLVKELFLGALVCDELLLGTEAFVRAATESHREQSNTDYPSRQDAIQVLLLVGALSISLYKYLCLCGSSMLTFPDILSYNGGGK